MHSIRTCFLRISDKPCIDWLSAFLAAQLLFDGQSDSELGYDSLSFKWLFQVILSRWLDHLMVKVGFEPSFDFIGPVYGLIYGSENMTSIWLL